MLTRYSKPRPMDVDTRALVILMGLILAFVALLFAVLMLIPTSPFSERHTGFGFALIGIALMLFLTVMYATDYDKPILGPVEEAVPDV